MSKLLRLVSTHPNCEFNTYLNDEIELASNAEVAFQNMSIEVQKKVITIDGSNDKLTYSFKNNHSKDIFLNHGTYTDSNFQDLLDDIKNKLNKSMVITDNKSIGMQWNVELTSEKKVLIQYKISNYINFFDEYDKGNTDLIHNNINFIRSNIRRQGGTPGTDDSFISYKQPLTRGCGVFRFLLKNLTASTSGAQDGVIIGLSDLNPTLANISLSNIKYGIHAYGTNEDYRVIQDGSVLSTITGVKPNIVGIGSVQNDYLTIINQEGKILLGRYNYNGSKHVFEEFHNVVYNNTIPYYPVIIFRGADSQVQIINITYTEDPYVITSSFNSNAESIEIEAVPTPSGVNTANYFIINDTLLSEFLGFDTPRIPTVGTTLAYNIYNVKGEKSVYLSILGDSFCVLLDNIELESYDTETKQRQNILATIPQSDISDYVLYDAKYLNFIKIRNQNPLKIRNIKARITDNSLGSITTIGRSVLTIIFK